MKEIISIFSLKISFRKKSTIKIDNIESFYLNCDNFYILRVLKKNIFYKSIPGYHA